MRFFRDEFSSLETRSYSLSPFSANRWLQHIASPLLLAPVDEIDSLELLLDDLASWRQGSRETWLFFSKERLLLPMLLPLLQLSLPEPALSFTSCGSTSFLESLPLREA